MLKQSAIDLVHLSAAAYSVRASEYVDLSYRQCPAYAAIAAHQVGATSEFIAIQKEGEEIGLACVRVRRAPLLPLGLAFVPSGPLTRRGGDGRDASDCLRALADEYTKRRKLVLRITPPVLSNEQTQLEAAAFKAIGFHVALSGAPYRTILMDIRPDLERIRANLDKKWRYDLTQASKANLRVARSVVPDDLLLLKPLLAELAKKKNFVMRQGTDFFRRVWEQGDNTEKFVLHLVYKDDRLVAGHLGSFAGHTAVYILGASNEEGRALRASYLIQWAVIEHAHAIGQSFYDLGGIDPEKNPDVYRFKNRMNGSDITLPGPFIFSPGFFQLAALGLVERGFASLRAAKTRLRD